MTTPDTWHEAAQHILHREQRRPCPDCNNTVASPWYAGLQPGEHWHCYHCGGDVDLPNPTEAYTGKCDHCHAIVPVSLADHPDTDPPPTPATDGYGQVFMQTINDPTRTHDNDCIQWCNGENCHVFHSCWCAFTPLDVKAW